MAANLPITYVNDPVVVSPVTIVGGGTVSMMAIPGQPIPVIVTGGSVSFNLSAGDVAIGDVHIIDSASGEETSILKANIAKSATEDVLMVQHIDQNGAVLSQTSLANVDTNTAGIDTNTATSNVLLLDIVDTGSVHTGLLQQLVTDSASSAFAQAKTLTVIMNNQGTQATSANQTAQAAAIAAQTAVLTAILNSEGTLSTSALQTALAASVAAQTAVLTALLNETGTLATSANQTAINTTLSTTNSILQAIHNDDGTLATSANQVANAAALAAQTAVITAVLNNEGTLATSANQVAQSALLANIQTSTALTAAELTASTCTYGATGTVAASALEVLVGLNPRSPSTDAFGRLRTCEPAYRFDGQLTYNVPADLWDSTWNSTGTVAYDATNRLASVTCASNGTAIMQSHYHAPYTPGRSQFVFTTFSMGAAPLANVSKRVGYYDGSNGIYLEQTSAGINLVLASTSSNGNQTIAQANWNIDKMDGTGRSGITLDLTKVQIMAVSLQALYTGRVIVGFDINGILWPVHQFTHANLISNPYIAQANLPIRYEVRSTGVNTGSLNAICASVISEGGDTLSGIPGRTFTATTSSNVAVTTRRPIISIRPAQSFNGQTNNSIILPTQVSVFTSAQSVLLELVRNATLPSASWSNVDATNSSAQFDTTASTLSGGSSLYAAMVANGGSSPLPIDPNLLGRLVISYSQLLNLADTLSLVLTSLAGSTNCQGCVMWKELR